MSIHNHSKIVTDNLVFYYDSGNIKSWKGQPTTNLVSDSMSIYNNVPAHVTATLTTTGETFRGATVYALTLTPTTATGVSYLTAGNNPGIGVVSNGGGGLAGRYTGHSIFFKPTVALHTTPIFTNYSNIPGWQSSTNNHPVEDGWFRAHVIWYDTVTRSDGKYWAINPASATINVPIVTYFAGPFKEDRNDSAFVAQYTPSSRGSTDALVDLTGRNTLTPSNMVYGTDGLFSFNGSNSCFDLNNNALISGTQAFTIEAWYYTAATDTAGREIIGNYGTGYTGSGQLWFATHGLWIGGATPYHTGAPLKNGTYYTAATRTAAGATALYKNGILDQSGTNTTSIASNINWRIGKDVNGDGEPFNGNIYMIRVYSKALSAGEIYQNYLAQKSRFERFGGMFSVTNSGASSYLIDGVANPTLTLRRGYTYYFSLDAAGHPFWIKTSAITGTTGSYDTNVANNGITSGVVTFNVPTSAPNTLYYICQFHGSMVGTLNIVN